MALIENGIVQEVQIERSNRRGMVGNIYKGTVRRVLPGMQAAFINIGLERTAFLHVLDIKTSQPNNPHKSEQSPAIENILQEGQEVIVQVTKDPLGTKGARLSMQLSIPSRLLVYLPSAKTLNLSQKIEDEFERKRLLKLAKSTLKEKQIKGGFIIRTSAEGATGAQLAREMQILDKIWQQINDPTNTSGVGGVLHQDLPLAKRVIRDMLSDDIEKLKIDSQLTFSSCLEFSNLYTPELTKKLEYYQGDRPIFDLYSVDDEIQKALAKKVSLKSGGYLIIDQTEALTTIDVNTGAFVGKKNLEQTIFKTNLEATQAVARQLRLRNLGGIIIIDFIDMELEKHKDQVLRSLDKYLQADSIKTNVSEVSNLGLVEMTRKRTRESLEHILCESCPSCEGHGYLKTSETVCYEIFREIIRVAKQFDAKELLVLAAQPVIERIIDEESGSLIELEEFVGKPIRLQAETLYAQDKYDVIMV